MSSVGLPTCSACARYLSPTRWDVRISSRSISHYPRQYIQNQSQSRGTSMGVSKKMSPASKSLEAFLDLKNGIKAWAKNKRPTFDVDSVVRVVGALNVDLPKSFPDYRKILPNWRRQESQNPEAQKSTSNENSSSHTVGDNKKIDKSIKLVAVTQEKDFQNKKPDDKNNETQPEDMPNYKMEDFEVFRQKRKELLEKTDSQTTILREQHDLEQAFQYYSSISFPDMSSQSKSHSNGAGKTAKSTGAYVSRYTDTVTKYIPQVILDRVMPVTANTAGNSLPNDSQKEKSANLETIKKNCISRKVVERSLRGSVIKLRKATSNASRLLRLEELCKQLLMYPESRCLAQREKAIPLLLELRHASDQAIREQANQALVLLGHIDRLPARGIRILSLDGGGTRALVAIEILKQIEATSRRPIYELFDFVCGVSTGSLLGAMLSIWRLPLADIEHIYKEFSSDMFTRSRLAGALTSMRSHAYYNTEEWEKILQETLGYKSFLDTTKDPTNPKISIISSIVNVSGLQNFIFRNYNYPSSVESIYTGSMKYKLWEAIRASSAAPLYYEEFKRDEYVHQDGGVLQNNPTAIALHEAKLLWPKEKLHCVVSIGNGRFAPKNVVDSSAAYSSIKQKLSKIIDSATDTEAVHTVLSDLLPHSSYFRFNPYMSEEFSLDEVRRDKWDTMQQDAQMYLRKNEYKIKMVAEKLTESRRVDQKVNDWIVQKRNLHEF